MKSHRSRSNASRNRRGAIMLLFLLLLPILILFVGFSVDYALAHKTRSEVRRATDLAAKAAAAKLAATEKTSEARDVAKQIAQLNKVHGNGLTLENSDIEFGTSVRQSDGTWDFTAGGGNPNAVRVTGRRTSGSPDGAINNYFGSFYGHPTFEPQFSSVAAFVNVDICLVLDRSSSMKLAVTNGDGLMNTSDPRFCDKPWADSRWTALVNAVNVFLGELDATAAEERVGVVSFASDYTSCSVTTPKVSVDRSLTGDTNHIRNALSSKSDAKWNGMTDIAAGIVSGQSVLTGSGSRATAKKIMVVMTDGQYTADNPNSAAQTAANAGIHIYTVTFSSGANQSDMQHLANIGNGQHYHADTATELAAAFRELGGSLVNLVQ